MIEANENSDLVTLRRQGDLDASRNDYREAVQTGRLTVTGSRQEQGGSPQPGTAPGRETGVSQTMTPVAPPAPADSEASWRHMRLGVTAGLVVLLLAVWIWQRKTGRT